jgi:uncharacterized alpha-E superfamily protein
MEKYVTANVATNLYWLGRYLERIAITLREIAIAYDKVIDVDKDAGVTLYKKFNIDLHYTNAYDFLNEAIYGDHSANLLTIMTNARENAIICRHLLDSEAFGEIIALHGLFLDTYNSHLDVDYKLMDHAQSLIGEIWNARSHREHQELSDSFFRIGKIVEEADHRIRCGKKEDESIIKSIVVEIDVIVDRLIEGQEPSLERVQRQSSCSADLLAELNAKIDKVIIE